MRRNPELQNALDEFDAHQRKTDRRIWIANLFISLIWAAGMIWLFFRALELQR